MISNVEFEPDSHVGKDVLYSIVRLYVTVGHFLSLEILFSAIRSRQSKPRQNCFTKKLLEFFNMQKKRDRNETS